MGVFEQARDSINRSLIESFFPGGEWKGTEYWCLSPLRQDSSIGSFHISEAGQFFDHATGLGGDLISLLVETRGLSKKQAAAEIVHKAGGTVEDDKSAKKSTKRTRIPALIPIPQEATAALNSEIKSEYARREHGDVGGGWRYHTADGGWAFAVVRYNKPSGGKDVIPYYYGTDSRWHEGQAYPDGRPLYNLPALADAEKILIVEGEKCAAVKVPGYVLTTWSAGASSTSKTDFSPLGEAAKAGRVTIWPDADESGIKAARAIMNRIPGARILDVGERPEGWDIADAEAAGMDLSAFIESCPNFDVTSAPAPDEETAQFFRCLGYDAEKYWFLREGKRSPQAIVFGSWTTSKLQELAPLAWWGMRGLCGDQGAIKLSVAQDYVIGIQDQVGRHDPDRLRGAGVWRDENDIIVNDGRRIIQRDGTVQSYQDFKTKSFYLSSDAIFGNVSGDASSDQAGHDLFELFQAQGWARPSHALAAFGWSLIAPFGGVLAWRPHIWVSGRKGTGKSYTLDNLIVPLVGPFGYKGSGKDSEAGIRRSLRTDARPAILDEMEPLDKRSAEKVTSILTLARNASSDASSFMTIANADGGTINFRIRSSFCFASIQVPDRGAAIESRILRAELRWHTSEAMRQKRERTATLLKRCFKDPGIFRRRIFRSLPQILDNIEFLRTSGAMDQVGDQRQVDQWAPILAAAFAVMHSGSIDSQIGDSFFSPWVDELSSYQDDSVEDEDRVIEHILGSQIENDSKKRRTVAEVLSAAANFADADKAEAADLLARYGMRLISKDGKEVLAIASRSDAIAGLLRGTPYEAGYDAQIRRHPLCLTPTSTSTARLCGMTVRVRLLDWEEFRRIYMKGEGE